MVTVAQVRAARALLGWSQDELARRAGVSSPTIQRLEGSAKAKASDEARAKAVAALEAAGVEFIPQNGGGPGVRLRKGGP